MAIDERPLVMHVVYPFDTGGLENGIELFAMRCVALSRDLCGCLVALPSATTSKADLRHRFAAHRPASAAKATW